MAWVNINTYILPASAFASIVILWLTAQQRETNGHETSSAAQALPTAELCALVADTTLTIGLFLRGYGGYKNWSSLTSLLPEIYLVFLLAARSWAVASDPFWVGHLEQHSAVLYCVRFACAVFAVVYSYYLYPRGTPWLGVARILFLGTLVWAKP